jgi:hypothetical protein
MEKKVQKLPRKSFSQLAAPQLEILVLRGAAPKSTPFHHFCSGISRCGHVQNYATSGWRYIILYALRRRNSKETKKL